MKFWLSSEAYKDIADKNRKVTNALEAELNSYFKDKSYGTGINEWNHISIILPTNILPPQFFEEVTKFHKKKNEPEFRLKLDYEKFLSNDETDCGLQILNSILRSIEIAQKEFNITEFSFRTFEQDLRKFRSAWENK